MDSSSIGLIAGIVLLVIGAIECFAGFKTFKGLIRLIAFFVCFLLGGMICYSQEMAMPVPMIVGLVAGIVGAIIAYKLYKIGVFIKSFIDGFLVATIANLGIQISKNENLIDEILDPNTAIEILQPIVIVSLIVGLIVAIIAVIFVKPVIILSSSFIGAVFCAVGISSIASITGIIIGIMVIGLFVLGMIVQIKTTGGFFETKAKAAAAASATEDNTDADATNTTEDNATADNATADAASASTDSTNTDTADAAKQDDANSDNA